MFVKKYPCTCGCDLKPLLLELGRMDVQDFWSEISVIQRHFKAMRSKSLCTLLNSTVGVKNVRLCFAWGSFLCLFIYLSGILFSSTFLGLCSLTPLCRRYLPAPGSLWLLSQSDRRLVCSKNVSKIVHWHRTRWKEPAKEPHRMLPQSTVVFFSQQPFWKEITF